MTISVKESGYRQGTRAVVPEGKGQKIRVRLMGWEPGSKVVEGSSADYPVSVIERDFADTFPVGTRMRANHDGFCEAGGDVRRIMAKTTSLPKAEADGMYADALVREGEPSDFIRQFADVIGTSISAGAEIEMVAKLDADGDVVTDENDEPVMVPKRSERGAQIVKRFLPMSESPYNAVDFVEAPGADGAIVKVATESAKALIEHMTIREAATFAIGVAGDPREKTEARKVLGETSETAPSRNTQKEKQMEAEEAQTIAENAATAAVKAYVESQAAPAPEQPSLGDIAEAVVTAGLTEAGRKAVYERVDRGVPVAEAIESEKAHEDAIRKELSASAAPAKRESVLDFGFTENDLTGTPLKGTEGELDQSKVDEAFDEMVEV
ncbi:MAG: hypothetical protein K0S70_129 [Microbacterium sp.]|jgi:hypothetical protein|nr:hypothetical protein [Microbacterium sp.]